MLNPDSAVMLQGQASEEAWEASTCSLSQFAQDRKWQFQQRDLTRVHGCIFRRARKVTLLPNTQGLPYDQLVSIQFDVVSVANSALDFIWFACIAATAFLNRFIPKHFASFMSCLLKRAKTCIISTKSSLQWSGQFHRTRFPGGSCRLFALGQEWNHQRMGQRCPQTLEPLVQKGMSH